MANIAFKSADQYIAKHPEAVRGVLAQVRAAIRKALPGASEVISYQIPAYRLNGRVVICFAGWAQHYSIYPCEEASIDNQRSCLEAATRHIKVRSPVWNVLMLG